MIATAIETLDEQSREIAGRSTGWCDGPNAAEQHAIATERAAILAAADPLLTLWLAVEREFGWLKDGRCTEAPGRPLGGVAGFQAYDELAREGNPSATHLRQREVHRQRVAEGAGLLAKAAIALACEAAKGLPLRAQLEASVKVERRIYGVAGV